MNLLERLVSRTARFSTPRDPDQWLVDWVRGGPETVSGEQVNGSTALSLSSYFAAIRAISEDTGKLPFVVYRRSGKRNKTRMKEHPVYHIIHDRANRAMSAMSVRETLTHHALGWGNGFAEIVRTPGGVPMELWPISPRQVRMEWSEDRKSLTYIVSGDRGTENRSLDSSQMFHLHGLGFDGVTGYSIATIAKETIGAGLGEVKSGAALFGNGSRPGGVLETAGTLDDEAIKHLRESWEEVHGGAGHHHKTAILEQGVTFKAISIPSKDAQWIEAKQHTVEEIARWFRIPPHKIQHLLRATFDNIEMQSIEYVTDTLLSWMVRWEQEVQAKLLNRSGDEQVFAEHIVDGLLRGDQGARFKAHATSRQWGWASANDVLALENRNSIGQKGDIYMVPANMMNAEQMLEPFEPETPPSAPGQPSVDQENEDENEAANLQHVVNDRVREVIREAKTDVQVLSDIIDAHRSMLLWVFQKLHHTEADKAKRAIRNGGIEQWAAAFYPKHIEYVGNELRPVVQSLFRSVCAGLNGSRKILDTLAESRTDVIVREWIEVSKGTFLMNNDYDLDEFVDRQRKDLMKFLVDFLRIRIDTAKLVLGRQI